MKYTFQVLLKAHDTGVLSWCYPPGERQEFATVDAALRAGILSYPDHNVQAVAIRIQPEVRPRGPFVSPDQPSGTLKFCRPAGKARQAAWAILRGVADARVWRSKCKRCGMTGQAHWDPASILVCRRFLP
jgi:hypothetical protein